MRSSTKGYRKDVSGAIQPQNLVNQSGSFNPNKFDWEDRFIKEGGLYQIKGRIQHGNDWFTEIQDMLTNETYMEM